MVTITSRAAQSAGEQTRQAVAVVVPHTHWDREWYAPFETLRFQLVAFLDELIEVLEREPDLPVFLLDGQSVILEDYLEVRRGQRDRVTALVRAGRLRPGPFYVQPDEFLVSGEALVRNLLLGCATARGFGWVMREGYLPDTFGHVHQLPQILRGFDIATFYAMRGFGLDPDEAGSSFWWAAPDGSRVRVEWLTESYSNAAVLTHDPDRMQLHHGKLVRYDNLAELLDRLAARSLSGALLLLNGGDHLRVQRDVPAMVAGLDRGVGATVRLGGLEDFAALAAAGPAPQRVIRGELRYAARHDVFDGIGSTRTPLKALNERTETLLAGVAERMAALAAVAQGPTGGAGDHAGDHAGDAVSDSLRYAWRLLLQNYAHDSICGCSIDAVHAEMELRFAKVAQLAAAVTEEAVARIGRAALAGAGDVPLAADVVPLVVVNPSGFPRSAPVGTDVLPDLAASAATLGQRRFGWLQGAGVDWSAYRLLDPAGRQLPFSVTPATGVTVADPLDRRKELRRDRIAFRAQDVPAGGTAVYRLVPASALDGAATTPPAGADRAVPSTTRAGRSLANEHLRVEIEADGTLAVTHLATGTTRRGLLELLDDGDAGDEYGFGPLGDGRTERAISSRSARWTVQPGPHPASLLARTTLDVPAGLTPDRRGRTTQRVELPTSITVTLQPGSDRVDIVVAVDNQARDHRLRLRLPVPAPADNAAAVLAESAYGVIHRDHRPPASSSGWHQPPTGCLPLRRFLAIEDGPAQDKSAQDQRGGLPGGLRAGLQVLTEGLHEYQLVHAAAGTAAGTVDGTAAVDVTMLRGVGWLARTDHPLRSHKVGPELPTPGAQCLGQQAFRLALRPFPAGERVGELYRAAEEFSVPLQAVAVQGRVDPAAPPSTALLGAPPSQRSLVDRGGGSDTQLLMISGDRADPAGFRLGLSVEPTDVVLSAIKLAEAGAGALVVRVFNAADEPVVARLRPRFGVRRASRTDLEERVLEELPTAVGGGVEVALAAGQIGTVRLEFGQWERGEEAAPGENRQPSA